MTAMEHLYWEAFWELEPWETTVLSEEESAQRGAVQEDDGRLLQLELQAMFEQTKAAKEVGDG